MKKWLKIGLGIGAGFCGIALVYLGTKMLQIGGIGFGSGLMTLAGLSLLVVAAKFFNDAENEKTMGGVPPMPPSIPKHEATGRAVPAAKKTRAKKKGRKK